MVDHGHPDVALLALRHGTRTEHERIEAVLRLTDPMALPRYAAILDGFDAFLSAWEPRVAAALPERLRPWFEARRRAAFAAADAAWLRQAGVAAAPAVDVQGVAAIALDTPARVFGSLYVIEGSALGGQVIAPQLKATLGLEPGAGASYFHGVGRDTGALWREYRQLAAREIGVAPDAVAQACDAARQTFAALIALFAPLADDGAWPTASVAAVTDR